ncbi:LCP family protein [Streptomyces sp. JJ38]|uniref:LCP family protein n=1 Tax=Streptomyces sp. JJ38 TaxID=2738128 RepID=UPI001C57E4F9|nr:LCP family protein [Streptomyces sp. JJ38]MBW1595718.1 LytR family transcriptional regulator [Streptomyces sp. JJ38]
MSDWPQGPTGGRDREQYGRGASRAEPEGARVMRTVRGAPGVPSQPPGGYDAGQAQGHDGYGQPTTYGSAPAAPAPGYDPGYDAGAPGQPGIPRQAGPGHGSGGPGGVPGPAPRPRPNWRRRITVGLVVCLAALLVIGVGTYFWADGKLRRDVDLAKVEDRPEAGKGTNYLIVGSDSREGLSDEDKDRLRTGSADGRRTDSMMILHVGDNGNSLISLPRDSWVTIPEFTGSESGNRIPAQQQKLNTSFSIQGPELLVRTVEYNTGLRIDHYAEIGFGGFANIVDALGGVEMCFDKPVKDKNSGADFAKGCHRLDGAESLAFVRNRYNVEGGDLGRTQNQQKLLAALAKESATPSTVLNPFSLYPTMGAGLDSLIVDKDMGLFDLASMFWAMKGLTGGDGTQMNMPLSGFYAAPGGQSALKWDMERVKPLMEQLKNDEKVTVKGGM